MLRAIIGSVDPWGAEQLGSTIPSIFFVCRGARSRVGCLEGQPCPSESCTIITTALMGSIAALVWAERVTPPLRTGGPPAELSPLDIRGSGPRLDLGSGGHGRASAILGNRLDLPIVPSRSFALNGYPQWSWIDWIGVDGFVVRGAGAMDGHSGASRAGIPDDEQHSRIKTVDGWNPRFDIPFSDALGQALPLKDETR